MEIQSKNDVDYFMMEKRYSRMVGEIMSSQLNKLHKGGQSLHDGGMELTDGGYGRMGFYLYTFLKEVKVP